MELLEMFIVKVQGSLKLGKGCVW